MREYPRGGIIGKTVLLLRRIRTFQVPLHAANACYFIVMAVFPALLLLLGLLRFTPLEVERLTEMLYGFFPEALAAGAEELILLTYDNTAGSLLGLSAVTALWSSSRGIHGILMGLKAVFGVPESGGYVRNRLVSMFYMFAFLLLMVLTLGFYVFRSVLIAFLELSSQPLLRFLAVLLSIRLLIPLCLQTGFFAVMFMAVPGEKSKFRENLPGALLAALGWQIFSDLYSVYMEHFTPLSSIYGSVYAIALGMLWLYCCMSIVFYGGVLNVLLQKKRENI